MLIHQAGKGKSRCVEEVALVILLLVRVLARYGECTMVTPLGNVGMNVISGFVSAHMVTKEECICRKPLVSQAISLDAIS